MCSSNGDKFYYYYCVPAATISYAGTPFCKTLVGAQSVTQTGTAAELILRQPD